MICPNCGRVFTPLSVNQIYCCNYCGRKYRHSHSVEENYPSITFRCSNCGKLVVTDEGVKDKRTRFCCESCEKKYWKHKYRLNNKINGTRINFRSIDEYASYEKRTNDT